MYAAENSRPGGKLRPQAGPTLVAGAPYRGTTASQPQSIGGGGNVLPYATARTLRPHIARAKPLPPDATADASQCTLFQLTTKVAFRCIKCRKDNIVDDVVACDEAHGTMLCARCFARIVRPRLFRPTRVVPFPSLLSWLNTAPPKVHKAATAAAASAGGGAASGAAALAALGELAAAAVPSGRRAATDLIAAAPSSVSALPATPMVNAAGVVGEGFRHANAYNGDAAAELAEYTASRGMAGPSAAVAGGASAGGGPVSSVVPSPVPHPCLSTFGSCAHGEAFCFFVRAPSNLCLRHLMGLCPPPSSSVNTVACGRVHQSVFDLPPPPAPPRWLQSLAAPQQQPPAANPAFEAWVARRRASANRAEWQLWNTAAGPRDVAALLDEWPRPVPVFGATVAPITADAVKSALAAALGTI